ncbi:MAG: hypothetical protein M3040_10050 [Bacteroidota bacterium]|nr:hypothetical protein [Bacteroidota bacterium]
MKLISALKVERNVRYFAATLTKSTLGIIFTDNILVPISKLLNFIVSHWLGIANGCT